MRPLTRNVQGGWELFLISFVILFLELTFIRWIAAHVVFVTFFSNFILVACFFGMSLGCLLATRRKLWTRSVLWFVFVTVCFASIIESLVSQGMLQLQVDRPASPERIFFGTIWEVQDFSGFLIPVEVALSIIYILVVLVFVCLGQLLGQLLDRFENRIGAYTLNIGGSLAGIFAFAFVSHSALPAGWWFGIGVLGLAPFMFRGAPVRRRFHTVLLAAAIVFCVIVLDRKPEGVTTVWSPYYRITYYEHSRTLKVNEIGHQVMLDREAVGAAYSLPYLLARASGLSPFRDVLVIGAGTGNDVSHALWHDVKSVEAVEIDPEIARIGSENHPNRPYDDPRVRLHVDDGRAFLGNTDKKYDLVVYALLDSLTLHSSYSSVRLENYLFTENAFRAVKEHLNPGGLFVVYNYYRMGWLVTRLHEMLTNVFGEEPIVISLPSKSEISDTEPEGKKMTMILSGQTEAIKERFDKYKRFVVKLPLGEASFSENGFRVPAEGAVDGFHGLYPSLVRKTTDVQIPTDDWPFIYLKSRRIPPQNILGLLIILAFSTLFLLCFKGREPLRLNSHFLFLGAGFMLIETVSITRLAVLFGSTWVVSSIVFAAILIMILLSNLYFILFKPCRLLPYYVGLLLALGANGLVDVNFFLREAFWPRLIMSSLFLFAPVFFSGVIFASSFSRSERPELDFGSNIAGVVIGAVLESLSLIVGYRAIVFVIVFCYILSLRGVTQRLLGSRCPG